MGTSITFFYGTIIFSNFDYGSIDFLFGISDSSELIDNLKL